MRSSEKRTTRVRSAGLVAAGLVAGGILAATIGASAAGSGSSGSGATGSGTTGTVPPPPYAAGVPGHGHGGPPGGFAGGRGRSDEKVVTGADATAMTAKARAKVPGATVLRVETDAGDAAYEVHMRKSDGSMVTVKFDKNLDITAVEDGMGKGDPMPAGGTAPSTSGGTAG